MIDSEIKMVQWIKALKVSIKEVQRVEDDNAIFDRYCGILGLPADVEPSRSDLSEGYTTQREKYQSAETASGIAMLASIEEAFDVLSARIDDKDKYEEIYYRVMIEKGGGGVKLGIHIRHQEGGGVAVERIVPGIIIKKIDPDAEGQIRRGDKLVGVEDEDVTNWPTIRVSERLGDKKVPVGTVITLVFARRRLREEAAARQDNTDYVYGPHSVLETNTHSPGPAAGVGTGMIGAADGPGPSSDTQYARAQTPVGTSVGTSADGGGGAISPGVGEEADGQEALHLKISQLQNQVAALGPNYLTNVGVLNRRLQEMESVLADVERREQLMTVAEFRGSKVNPLTENQAMESIQRLHEAAAKINSAEAFLLPGASAVAGSSGKVDNFLATMGLSLRDVLEDSRAVARRRALQAAAHLDPSCSGGRVGDRNVDSVALEDKWERPAQLLSGVFDRIDEKVAVLTLAGTGGAGDTPGADSVLAE
jgi:hypothetical protein